MNANLMTSNLLIIFFTAVILIWQVALTILFVRLFNHYKGLVKDVTGDNLEKILKKNLQRQNLNEKQITDITKEVSNLKKDGSTHIQKIGFVRFNPFNETGGDNSFTFCLLDGKSDGVLITGLHTREKTRIYAKPVKNGKSDYELSKEELKAIKESLK